MAVLSSVLMVAFLIAVNALYVAAEFGAVSARRSRIRQLAEEGNRLAQRLLPVLRDPDLLDRWIAGCQIGVTFCSLVLGAYGEARLAPVLAPIIQGLSGLSADNAQSASAAVVLIALTVLQMIIGELVPKSIALQFSTQAALYTALPVRGSLRVFSAFISLVNGTGQCVLRLLGIRRTDRRHIHSPEEIELLIAESSSGGHLRPEEKEQLRRALRLSLRDARQLMVPRSRILAIDVDAAKEELLSAIEGPYTRLPVYRTRFDDMIGILHTKDVVVQRVKSGRIGPVRAMMRPISHVAENARADEMLVLFREQRTHLAVVKSATGVVVGLVTLEDVLSSVFGDAAPQEPDRRRQRREEAERIRRARQEQLASESKSERRAREEREAREGRRQRRREPSRARRKAR